MVSDKRTELMSSSSFQINNNNTVIPNEMGPLLFTRKCFGSEQLSEAYRLIFKCHSYPQGYCCCCGKGNHCDLAMEALQKCAYEFQVNLNNDLTSRDKSRKSQKKQDIYYLKDVLHELYTYYYCGVCFIFDADLYIGMLCEINSEIVKKLEDSGTNIREELRSYIRGIEQAVAYTHDSVLKFYEQNPEILEKSEEKDFIIKMLEKISQHQHHSKRAQSQK